MITVFCAVLWSHYRGRGQFLSFLCSQIERESKFLSAFFTLCFVTISSTCVAYSKLFMLRFNFILGLSWLSLYFVFFVCYCAFHKHANSKGQKRHSQLRFSLPSIIITITSNEPWNTQTQNGSISTNHKPWPFEPVKVKFCFLRGPLGWVTAAKNAIVKAAFELQNSHVCEKRSNEWQWNKGMSCLFYF